jgi:hypothetical protein
MKLKPHPSFFKFFVHRTDNNRDLHYVLSDLHYALSEEEEGGIVSNYLYRDTVATGIVMSAHPSLLMHISNRRADVTMPIATDNARHY